MYKALEQYTISSLKAFQQFHEDCAETAMNKICHDTWEYKQRVAVADAHILAATLIGLYLKDYKTFD